MYDLYVRIMRDHPDQIKERIVDMLDRADRGDANAIKLMGWGHDHVVVQDVISENIPIEEVPEELQDCCDSIVDTLSHEDWERFLDQEEKFLEELGVIERIRRYQ